MKRLQLFEFEDQKWFPGMLRDYMTGILRYANNLVYVHSVVLPLIKEIMTQTKEKKIVDLCSGGIGPWDQLYKDLRESFGEVSLTLTDKYPNMEMCGKNKDKGTCEFEYLEESVDARNIPENLKGIMTLFSGLHHFKPENVRKILKNAVDNNIPIGIFEYAEKGGMAIAKILLAPLFVWIVTPFLRPLTFSRFLWTYIIPVIPICFLWDALVSCLRTYSIEDLEKFTKDLKKEGYTWKIGTCSHAYPSFPIRLTYLLGYKEEVEAAVSFQREEVKG